MGNKKIILVAGARPNFMKIAPLIDAIALQQEHGADIDYELVHTGQHFDQKMSDEFFKQLGIPNPKINLSAGGGTQAEQTAAIMVGFERYLEANSCDIVVVVGDVTSTLACAIVAKKMGIPVSHVEGGIRSGDMTMPEEINRIVTDSITDIFFTTSMTATENLVHEGKGPEQIFFVGNTMIDTLIKHRAKFRKPACWDSIGLEKKKYLVMTLHRPSNVDTEYQLKSIATAVEQGASGLPVVFPVHPRTRNNIERFGIGFEGIRMTEPMGYLDFNFLVQHSSGVITDSGGITEETTVLGVPCITLRESTERPETVSIGTNELIGTNPEKIRKYVAKMAGGNWKKGSVPEKWDGMAATRIVSILLEKLK